MKLEHYENEFLEDISRIPEDITAESIMSYTKYAYKRTTHYGDEIRILCKSPLEFMQNYDSMNSTLIFNLSLLNERIERRLFELKTDMIRLSWCKIITRWNLFKEYRLLSQQHHQIQVTINNLNKLLDIMISNIDDDSLHDIVNIHEENLTIDDVSSDGIVWVDLL